MSGTGRRKPATQWFKSLLKNAICSTNRDSPSGDIGLDDEFKEPKRPNVVRRRMISILRSSYRGQENSSTGTGTAEVTFNRSAAESSTETSTQREDDILSSSEISFRTDDDLAKRLGFVRSSGSRRISSGSRRVSSSQSGRSHRRYRSHSKVSSYNSREVSVVIEDVHEPIVYVIEPEMIEDVQAGQAGAPIISPDVQREEIARTPERPYIARVYVGDREAAEMKFVQHKRSESEPHWPLHGIPSPGECLSAGGRLQEYSFQDIVERELYRSKSPFPMFVVVEADQASREDVIHRLSVADADSKHQMFVVVESEPVEPGRQKTILEDEEEQGGARSPSAQSGKSELIAEAEGDESEVELSYCSAASRLTELTHVSYQSKASVHTRLSSIDWDAVHFRLSAGSTESAAEARKKKDFNLSRTIVRAPINSSNHQHHGRVIEKVDQMKKGGRKIAKGRRNHPTLKE
jgi:hypothetical protein